jgi:hypothetical protein
MPIKGSSIVVPAEIHEGRIDFYPKVDDMPSSKVYSHVPPHLHYVLMWDGGENVRELRHILNG